MHSGTLLALYFAIGLVCAGFVLFPAPERNARAVGSALATVVLWPLWAPFALASPAATARGPLASRIALALGASPSRFAKASKHALLSRGETTMLLQQVEVAERRLSELDAQLTTMATEDARSRAEGTDAHARAQIRASSKSQLAALRDREHGALLELAELCELLRAQHLLSRFDGSARTAELRDELWARVQALSELAE
jgi:hypothetical protein